MVQENISQEKKFRRYKILFSWRNEVKWIDE